MILLSLLPLLILAGIFAFIIWGYRALSFKNPGRKLAKWLIVGYAVILVAGTVYSYSEASTKQVIGKTVSRHEVKKQDKAQIRLFDRAREKGVLQINNDILFKKSEKSFPFKGKQLTVSIPDSYNLFVDRDPGFQGEVVVTHYMSRTFIGNMDVTEKRKEASIALKNSVLDVTFNKTKLHLAAYSEGFVFHQFNGGKRESVWEGDDPVFGDDFILLKVPQGIKVTSEDQLVTNVTVE
ncbi:hypothetical protein SAMN04488137_3870 [Fictibacillus solisalsi]|uniref:Uncharacterized protein n=1 Tax=Fictibacillus solisalsi TaxID=459525 RepID=A0A1H0A3R9_9BACL|nr:hypothetical protein [Fictibacillus solisalsi]SDN27336.1 hypothetical protein SAMN04488137_3870 [Fictibacillus solisalsi]